MTVRSPSEDRSLGRLEPVRVAGDLPRPDVLSGAVVRLLMNHHRPVIHAPASAADRHSLLTTRRNHLNDVGTKVVQRPGNSAVDGRDAVRHPRRNLVGATVIRHFRPFPGKTRGLFPGTTALKHPAACAVPSVRRCRVKAGQADGDNARAAAALRRRRRRSRIGVLTGRAHVGSIPHRIVDFKLSTAPQFIDKVRHVVGLYLNPPDAAVVSCVDEKPLAAIPRQPTRPQLGAAAWSNP